MKKQFFALAFGLSMATLLHAESLRAVQYEQRQRIAQGIRSGELTRPEASRLAARQAALNREARQDLRDGRGLTWAERQKFDARQDRLSRSIYRQKHDRQDR